MESPEMKISDVARELRKVGICRGNLQIGDMIESGLYPFGKVTNVGPSGRRTFYIRRVDFLAWLKAVTDYDCGDGGERV